MEFMCLNTWPYGQGLRQRRVLHRTSGQPISRSSASQVCVHGAAWAFGIPAHFQRRHLLWHPGGLGTGIWSNAQEDLGPIPIVTAPIRKKIPANFAPRSVVCSTQNREAIFL